MEHLTFEQLPEAVTLLTQAVSELKRLIMAKQEQAPTNELEQLLSIDEVATLLHLTKPTIYSKVSRNEIPGVCKQGKRLYFERETIMKWLKKGRRKTATEIDEESQKYLKKANR